MVTFENILDARERLHGVAHRTPVISSRQFNERAGCQVFFKCENQQRMGAFKFRGAYNKLAAMTAADRKPGIIAYSSGNHAQAAALAAKLFGVSAVIVMPEDAPKAKVAATREYGAEIVFYDRYSESRETTGEKIARERGLTLVPPFDDEYIIAGQGTAALELLEEVPGLDALLVPCSGCGLLAGSAIAARHLRPAIRVYGAEPEAANDTWLSIQKGEIVEIPVPRTIADGLQTTSPGKITFPIVRRLVENILLINDQELIGAMRFLLERMKVLAEPSGAAGAAALLRYKQDFSGARVGIILSGGNVDLDKLAGYLTA
ncbi:MAG: threo-3-hydroxy-L-aspartate ammonia-lyase [Blastocatellia bacterium]